MNNSFTERELSEIHARYVKQLEADLAAARAAGQARKRAVQRMRTIARIWRDQWAQEVRGDIVTSGTR